LTGSADRTAEAARGGDGSGGLEEAAARQFHEVQSRSPS
jgi:hypothetical protein